MFLGPLFRSFTPLHNPLGFGAGDFIELALAAMLVVLALEWRPWIEPVVRRLASRTGLCILALAALPVLLRLALLSHHPVPSPEIYDEFSHLLVADTLRHFRLANPSHPFHQFFETLFVLQQPTYSSIYPIGQGLVLAIGWLILGSPWAGVMLSVAALCGLCYWMLRGWTTPAWALAGGMLAVIEFGPLNAWMNSYWGGAASATAGCLVFGSLPRLLREPRRRNAVWLGIGLGLQLLTRPFEFLLLCASVMIYFLPVLRSRKLMRSLIRLVPAAGVAFAPAAGLMLLHNHQVTGRWTTLPYFLSRYQYGVPATFTVQPNPVPHRALTQTQQLIYSMQTGFHGRGTDTVPRYFERLEYRIRDYRFFLLAPLYLTLAAFVAALREFRFVWVSLTLLIFAIGSNFYPFFFPHYIAAVTCLFVLVSVTGLERLSRLTIRGRPVGREGARLILFVCVAQFAFWYGLHVFDASELAAAFQYETWDSINHQNPAKRIAINRRLAQAPGRQLVFVSYWPQHPVQEEWVYNAADIDSSRIVWALDLGAAENQKLRRYYPGRTAWRLEPDARPPKLTPYQPEPLTNVEGP